jgi:muramoyltetrapeptide carboxypeptidase
VIDQLAGSAIASVAPMDVTYPRKLAAGDEVRVIAPSGSRAMVAEHDHSEIIEARFDQLGLTLSYGAHVDERDARDSSSVTSRVTDLHDAFADASVAGILTVIGGFNSNELLPHLDWELIRSNPKVFCGYSDITALQGAMLARAGLVTYSGPHWSSFGMEQHFEQTLTWFADALMHDPPVMVTPSHHWTDDMWFLDQDNRQVYPSPGWWNLQPGEAEGRLVGGNLCTLNLLQGTPYMPPIGESVLIIEDDAETSPNAFARDLTSLLQLPEAVHLRGLVIGRFQRDSGIDRDMLEHIVSIQPVLDGVPVVANTDVGHTFPMATVPIGGEVRLDATTSKPHLVLTKH